MLYLLLAAGELVRVPLGVLLDAHGAQARGDAVVALLASHLLELEPESDVLLHREVREKGVGLEHHRHRPFVGGRDVHLRRRDPEQMVIELVDSLDATGGLDVVGIAQLVLGNSEVGWTIRARIVAWAIGCCCPCCPGTPRGG